MKFRVVDAPVTARLVHVRSGRKQQEIIFDGRITNVICSDGKKRMFYPKGNPPKGYVSISIPAPKVPGVKRQRCNSHIVVMGSVAQNSAGEWVFTANSYGKNAHMLP